MYTNQSSEAAWECCSGQIFRPVCVNAEKQVLPMGPETGPSLSSVKVLKVLYSLYSELWESIPSYDECVDGSISKK